MQTSAVRGSKHSDGIHSDNDDFSCQCHPHQLESDEPQIDKLLAMMVKSWEKFSKEAEDKDSVSLLCDSLMERLRSLNDPMKLLIC